MNLRQEPVASLSSLSTVLDLANGLDGEKSLLTGLFALELALDGGLAPADARAAFYVGLLRHLGCTAYAAEESRLGNDVHLRRNLLRGDAGRSAHVVRSVLGASSTLPRRVAGLARLLTSSRRLRSEWFAEACGAARLLASGLGLDARVLLGLDEAFERWDGAGGPRHLGGSDLLEVGRVAQAAHVAVVFFVGSGVAVAQEALALQSGTTLDPSWAKRALRATASLQTLSDARIEAAEACLLEAPPTLDANTLATTFGDFADLQSPFTRGHSRRVADVCATAAPRLGLDAAEHATLQLAAHLHDLGHVTLPTDLWLRPDWSSSDRELSRAHAHATERLLAATPMLRDAARLAGAHHERLDGGGYPRGLAPAALSRAARLLAVADAWCALQEARPHRPARSGAQARRVLEAEVKEGRLDADCVAVVVGARDVRRVTAPGPTSALTPREVDVLRLLAGGATNKEIARALGVSDRTVQHHTIHIYEKLGVSTRAGASLVAARAGIV
ncbi:LuxR C-terminal-related transcriptional regulator [Myxococcus stipitatus]|uniref:HD domain-containing phosphohydrolase n=1 Tax=Myxococcus stipitatus TaxID=83455 RepID=UPI00314530A0